MHEQLTLRHTQNQMKHFAPQHKLNFQIWNNSTRSKIVVIKSLNIYTNNK